MNRKINRNNSHRKVGRKEKVAITYQTAKMPVRFWLVANFNWMKKWSSMHFFVLDDGLMEIGSGLGCHPCQLLQSQLSQRSSSGATGEIYRFDWIMVSWQLPVHCLLDRLFRFHITFSYTSNSMHFNTATA